MMFSYHFLVTLLVAPLVLGAPTFPGQADQVGALPGVNLPITYKHYSGYLDSIENIKLHYWFFESQTGNPEKNPVALWLNGGPGCSSLFGAFTELGPIRANINGTFSVNPDAWTQKANVLFLETPVYVGFSYPANNSRPQENNDERTVQQNMAALRSFFAKFPHLASNDFYITGESYAGRYIPQLSVAALKAKYPVNFKGVAIGNGYLNGENDMYNYFAYYHGITDSLNAPDQPFQLPQIGINVYNILANCNDPMYPMFQHVHAKGPSATLNSLPHCTGASFLGEWLNRNEVQKAIHIDTSVGITWKDCGGYDFYHKGNDSMAPQIKYMVDNGLKVIIYNGDLDAACNFVGDRAFIEKLGYKVVTGVESWNYKNYVGGFRVKYEKNLTFTTIRGAGHMVPTDKPGPALKMFNEFLLGL